ncbi:hypothetical protein GCM10028773_26030 [Spirosoma koreense]
MVACTDHTEPSQTTQTCRIASIVSDADQENWEYTADGQLKTYRSLRNGQIAYTYDANQFMVSNTVTDITGAVQRTNTFEYIDNRLTKWFIKGPTGSIVGSRVLEYDGSGNLSRYVDLDGSVNNTYTFTGDQLISQTFALIDVNGNPVDGKTGYTFENGRLIMIREPDGQTTTRLFDAQGRVVRSETKAADTLNRYYTSEYTDGKSVYEAYVLPKGWPRVLRYYPGISKEYLSPNALVELGLDTKVEIYGSARIVPLTKKTYESITNYEKTGNGFPSKKYSVSSGETYLVSYGPNFKPINIIATPFSSTNTTTYTYTGCQERK